MKPFKKISIIGVGLIGGSLGLALKQRRRDLTIIGYDRAAVLRKALRRGAIDEAATDLLSAIIQSDCLIFATPISVTLDIIRSYGKFLSAQTVVSDVSSVKAVVMRMARRYLPADVLFIGGHPMAGLEKGGIDGADPLLLENALYVLCPNRVPAKLTTRERKKLNAFVSIIESTGARVMFLDAALHDRIAASISHMPQLLGVALMNLVGKGGDSRSLQLAAGGFRDMTRVASSSFEIWGDILHANKKEVSRSLGMLVRELQRYRSSVDSGRLRELEAQFASAKKLRDAIPKDMKGFHRPLVDILVAVEDKPGALSKITTALYRHRINIKDIELLKVREGETGTFRLSFETERVANYAARVLKKASYKAARR